MGFGKFFSERGRRRHVGEQEPEATDIVQDALARIDDEVNDSYYNLVPQSWQRFIDELVATAEHYQRHFLLRQAFEETIARYWVACHRTFAELARTAGFDEVRDGLDQAQTTNYASMVACLTGNLSYLLLTPASARTRRRSPRIEYRTSFLRDRPEVQDLTIKGSVRIVTPLAINERLEVAYCTGTGKSLLRTSPLISIHRQPFPHPAGRTWLNSSLQKSNVYLRRSFEADINHWCEGRKSASK